MLRKGGITATIPLAPRPLAPRTARAIDLAIGERLAPRSSGARTGSAWTATAPPGSCAASPNVPVSKPTGPHTLRHAFVTAALYAGAPLRDVQEAASHADTRTTMRYHRARVSLDRNATYLAGAAR